MSLRCDWCKKEIAGNKAIGYSIEAIPFNPLSIASHISKRSAMTFAPTEKSRGALRKVMSRRLHGVANFNSWRSKLTEEMRKLAEQLSNEGES